MARLSAIYVSLGAAAFLSACVARPVLVPAGGAQYAVAAQNNISIMSSGGEWPGDDSVYDYLTPLAVDIHNGSDETIVVSYKDFSLANDHGFHYSALNPFLHDGNEEGEEDGDENDGDMQEDAPRVAPPAAPRAQPSSRPSGSSTMLEQPEVTLALATDDASLVFVRGGGGGHGGGGGGGHGGGGGGAHGGFGGHGGVSGHYGYGGGAHYGAHGYYGRGYGYGYRGFRGGYYGGYRGFYGWRWGWGGWPWWGVPYYYYWGTPYYYYYGRQVPPSEIPQYALAEGAIKPGGDVHGFLYFQRATDRSHRLTLEWAVHEKGGAETAFLKVKLDVVHD